MFRLKVFGVINKVLIVRRLIKVDQLKEGPNELQRRLRGNQVSTLKMTSHRDDTQRELLRDVSVLIRGAHGDLLSISSTESKSARAKKVVRHLSISRNKTSIDRDSIRPATRRTTSEVLADGIRGINDRATSLFFNPASRTRISNLSSDTLAALADTELLVAAKTHSTGGISPVAVATALATGHLTTTEGSQIVVAITGDVSAAALLAVAGEVRRSGVLPGSSTANEKSKHSKRETHVYNKDTRNKKNKRKRNIVETERGIIK